MTAAGMGSAPLGGAGPRWRVCWCPAAPGSHGFFWARSGVLLNGGVLRGTGD